MTGFFPLASLPVACLPNACLPAEDWPLVGLPAANLDLVRFPLAALVAVTLIDDVFEVEDFDLAATLPLLAPSNLVDLVLLLV
ncbi:MAG: hypothetical protein IT422_01140 [Pirellulaceae bacterium]|nr:hypothetical protein [Pirellulaceae bacterium]